MKRRDSGHGAPEPMDARPDGDFPDRQEGNSESVAENGEATGTEETPTLSAALERIAELSLEIAEKDAAHAQLRDELLRERAELDNFKKRMVREKGEAIRYACEPLIRDLVPVIDNLERALAATGEGTDPSATAQALRQGIALVAQQLGEVLGRHGVKRIVAADREFDPNEHEALAHVVTTRKPPGAVLDEHLPGYRLHDRLIRPAQVTVAKSPLGGGN